MSVPSTGARIISFSSALQERADQARSKGAANGATVCVRPGLVVQQQAARVRASELIALARVNEDTQYFADAEASGVPPRVVHEAWDNYRGAVGLVRPLLEGRAISLTWGGERDCRGLLVHLDEAPVGRLSILDGARPRSLDGIAGALKELVVGQP